MSPYSLPGSIPRCFIRVRRISTSVVGSTTLQGVEVEISLSMGVALTDAACTTVDQLLQRADSAMYQSKRAGRGRLTLYTPGSDL